MSEAETKGKLVYELGNGQWDIPELRQLLEQILPQDKTVEGFEVTHTFEDIGERSMLLNARQLDSVELILLAIEDASERVQAQAALRTLNESLEQRVQKRTQALERSQLRFRQAFELSPVAAVMTTLEQERLVEVNESFLALTGYSPEEVIGKTSSELGLWSGPEDQEQLRHATDTEDGFRELELELRTKDGEVRDILTSGEMIRLDGEKGWLKMFVDVTEHKRSEEELMSAIQDVMSDTAWFSQQIVQRLANVRSNDSAEQRVDLTPRERQVLERIAAGMSDLDIVEELNLKRQTVRNYVSNIYSKIGVHSRAEAVVWARERGIIA